MLFTTKVSTNLLFPFKADAGVAPRPHYYEINPVKLSVSCIAYCHHKLFEEINLSCNIIILFLVETSFVCHDIVYIYGKINWNFSTRFNWAAVFNFYGFLLFFFQDHLLYLLRGLFKAGVLCFKKWENSMGCENFLLRYQRFRLDF